MKKKDKAIPASELFLHEPKAKADLERAVILATQPEQLDVMPDAVLDTVVNGNLSPTNQVEHEAHKKAEFSKLAHLFGHRKRGCQARFHKEYLELAKEVTTAWIADRSSLIAEVDAIAKSNLALAKTLFNRKCEIAKEAGQTILRTVFNRWKDELTRIVAELGGHPQEDGNVVFPDGSVAKMPRGLFIEPEYMVKFE